MIIAPINCPICQDPIVNTISKLNDTIIYKNCRLRPDHIFSCAVHVVDTTEYIMRLAFTLSMFPPLSVIYSFGEQDDKLSRMYINKSFPSETTWLNAGTTRLSFCVEPNFMDVVSYRKFVDKLKIYILFS